MKTHLFTGNSTVVTSFPSLAGESFPQKGVVAEMLRTAFSSSDVGDNPYMEVLGALSRQDWVTLEQFTTVVGHFGLGFLTQEAIDDIKRCTASCGCKIVSMFAGRGYAERQLEHAGCDVIGYDINPPAAGWLRNIKRGNLSRVTEHADRALFMAFPDKCKKRLLATETVELYRKAGGKVVVLLTPADLREDRMDSRHPFAPEISFADFMSQFKRVHALRMPGWAHLPELNTYTRSGITDFFPLLEIYTLQAAVSKSAK